MCDSPEGMVGWMPGWPILPARPRGLFGANGSSSRGLNAATGRRFASRSTYVPPIPSSASDGERPWPMPSPMRAIIFSAGRPRAESSAAPHGATYVPPDRSRGFCTLRESLSVRWLGEIGDARRRDGRRSSSSMSLCELCISALPWKSRIHENEHPVACCSRCFTSAVEHHALMMKRWLPGSTTTLMVGARARR